MKYLTLFAALLLCGNGQAATYVYQANPYQHHQGRCGKLFQPLRVKITVGEAFPPNSNLNLPLQTISVNAGEGFEWGERFTNKHSDNAIFTTDANGDIIAWDVSAKLSKRVMVSTINVTNTIEDDVEFSCGAADVENNPGTWKRTK
jgi:hypothetical protein